MVDLTALGQRFQKLDVKAKSLALFFFGVLPRLLFNLFFHRLYGPNAANHVELWLYTGVAQGTHDTARGLSDLSLRLLRLIGGILPPQHVFFGVEFLGVLLTSLTGVLLYVFLRNRFGEKKSAVAALIYLFMIEPFALSIVSFTHSFIQLNLILLSLIFTSLTLKYLEGLLCAFTFRKLVLSLTSFASYLVVVYVGLNVNEEIFVGVALSGVYFLRWATDIASKRGVRDYYPFLCGFVFGVILLGGFFAVKPHLDELLASHPQGESGSADITPISQVNIWLRYNVLLGLMPLAFVYGFRRRDLTSMSFVLLGFLFALSMDRGTRISNLGVAALAAHLLVDFRMREYRVFAPIFILTSLYFTVTQQPLLEFRVLLFVSSLLVLVFFRLQNLRLTSVVSLIIILCLLMNTVNFLKLDPKKISTQGVYRLLTALGETRPSGDVLIEWDLGFMAEVASGFESVSSPARIDYDLHHSLWLLERQAAAKLFYGGVDYVVFSNANYNLVRRGAVDEDIWYALSGGLIFRPREPKTVPPTKYSGYTAAYKLRHQRTDPRFFKEIMHDRDESTGMEFWVYEVAYHPMGFFLTKNLPPILSSPPKVPATHDPLRKPVYTSKEVGLFCLGGNLSLIDYGSLGSWVGVLVENTG
ncbi:MAG: hypothetical protein GF334_09150, partial [Candidatus Altiarchaeales archaeon]|nr:hypothetical protein [Candidatus Altiarchaeales archaeon]